CGLQRDSVGDVDDGALRARKSMGRSAGVAPALSFADGNQFRGVESNSSQSSDGGNGLARAGVAFADGCAEGGEPGAHSRCAAKPGSGGTSACCEHKMKRYSTVRQNATLRNTSRCLKNSSVV